VSPATSFFDEEMLKSYKNHAAGVFLGRGELLAIYRALSTMLKRPRTVDEIARKLSLSSGSAAFAVRVLTELGLLAFDKSGRILALNEGQPRKELRQSRCYANFEDLLNG
jgi:Mn-dependent DtxR family transcriptional regulator